MLLYQHVSVVTASKSKMWQAVLRIRDILVRIRASD
jgi:hypothetical protein